MMTIYGYTSSSKSKGATEVLPEENCSVEGPSQLFFSLEDSWETFTFPFSPFRKYNKTKTHNQKAYLNLYLEKLCHDNSPSYLVVFTTHES